MSQMTLSRQFITDASGEPVAVILPIAEYALVKGFLEAGYSTDENTLEEMEIASNDPLFLADLAETMNAFEAA